MDGCIYFFDIKNLFKRRFWIFDKWAQNGLNGNADMRIYLSGCKDCIFGEHTYLFFATTTPRRWTAISMGALRCQTAIGSLSTAGVPISQTFECPVTVPAIIFVHALLVHVFIVRVLLINYLSDSVSRDEYYC